MHRFKANTGQFVESHEITKENVQKYLQPEKKYLIQTTNGKRYTAVCPACKNPIRLFGITKEIVKTLPDGRKTVIRPYGKHLEHKTEIADYNKFAYEICPLSSHYRWTNIEDKWDEPLPINYEIYDALRENFDAVLYILAHSIGITKFPYNEAKTMLQNYLDKQGYMWKGATVDNLPWFLFYASGIDIRLWNKVVLEDSKLYNYLQTRKDINLIPEYLNNTIIGYRITSDTFLVDSIASGVYNRHCDVDEDLEEYIDCILIQLIGSPPAKTVWKNRIFVDLDVFSKIVNSSSRVRNEKTKKLGEQMLPKLVAK